VELHKEEAEGEGQQLLAQADQGYQAPGDHKHHLGLLQEAEQPQAQEDPAGDSCQGRGHKVQNVCLNIVKMCKILPNEWNVKNRRNFYGGKSHHFGQKSGLKIGKYADGNPNFTEIH
jgi:hypothetical protein